LIFEDRLSNSELDQRYEWDVFISHASEDKDAFVQPLAYALVEEGVRVWYDDFMIDIGDSLTEGIDEGLKKSRYGIVVLSKSYFVKPWSKRELEGLWARDLMEKTVILPVWLGVDRNDVLAFSPTLANRRAFNANDGIANVVTDLLRFVKPTAVWRSAEPPRIPARQPVHVPRDDEQRYDRELGDLK
jgi:hypothetical protein